jgi:signal transduction histidine kinase
MRERAELLGGQLRVGVRDGGGFEVTAQLPTAAEKI